MKNPREIEKGIYRAINDALPRQLVLTIEHFSSGQIDSLWNSCIRLRKKRPGLIGRIVERTGYSDLKIEEFFHSSVNPQPLSEAHRANLEDLGNLLEAYVILKMSGIKLVGIVTYDRLYKSDTWLPRGRGYEYSYEMVKKARDHMAGAVK
jgi:hypothetical protein